MCPENSEEQLQAQHDEGRVLFTWIGYADCRSAIHQLKQSGQISAEEADKLISKLPPETETAEKYKEEGKLARLLEEFPFSEIHVLTDLPDSLSGIYKRWIESEGQRITLHQVEVKDPYDYEEIYTETKEVLSKFSQIDANKTKSRAYFINPGTTAMGTTWTLLSKSIYPGTLYQLSGSQTQPGIISLPFEINVDFLPELEKRRNAGLLIDESPVEVAGLIGSSSLCIELKKDIGRYARTPYPVLLTGPNGSGKEVAAKGIHKQSGREGAFIAVNCGSIPKDLIESHLFGHFEGAFSDAKTDSLGKFHLADKGTLFLDEVGECSLDLQVKLLRALQAKDPSSPTILDIEPVGVAKEQGSKPELQSPVDVRVVFATNQNLAEMVSEKTFRVDLYYRISTLCINVPSLNKRVDDIPDISEHLLAKQNEAMNNQPGNKLPEKTLTVRAKNALCDQEWRGNIRQLNSVIIRAYLNTGSNPEIDEADITRALKQDPLANPATGSVLGKQLPLEKGELDELVKRREAEVRYDYLKRAYDSVEGRGRVAKAAKKVALKESTFRKQEKDACEILEKKRLLRTNDDNGA